ncbi:MAG: xylulokinase [Candidatus Bipolaricaulia bacterium]
MADIQYILAHDLGTTGDKATLYDVEGQLRASRFKSYETSYPHGNWVEQNPRDWWDAVCHATVALLRDAHVDPNEIAAISFSGQMMGCVAVDQDGEPLCNAIIWADQRGVEQARHLEQALGMEQVYRITGHRVSPSYSAAKILWVRDEQPQIFKRVHQVLQAKDYVVHKLTGKFATDYSDASGTNLFDLRDRQWSAEILDALELPESILPPVHPSTKVVGEVTTATARACGLKAGTPVVIGGGDGSCAATGAGVVREGLAYNYLGSSSWIALATPEPIYDPEWRTFNWVHLDPQLYSPCGTMQAAGGSFQWASEVLGTMEAQAARPLGIDRYKLLDFQIEKSPPGAGGLLFLPYLLGERSPHWNPRAKGAFIGLTRRHRRRDLVRAVLEGICFNLRIILEAFEDQGAVIEAVCLIGGGAQSEIWCRILADIYGKPVLLPAYLQEATSLGAAIAGGIGVELFDDFSVAERFNPVQERYQPNPDDVARYNRLFNLFQMSYRQLVDVYNELHPFSP